jgi:hypothetical protein
MPSSKGGFLQLWTADGKPDKKIYYGPGLTKSCPTCKVEPNVRCVTEQGRLYKKTHPSRLA